jgi:hypothetical protein
MILRLGLSILIAAVLRPLVQDNTDYALSCLVAGVGLAVILELIREKYEK